VPPRQPSEPPVSGYPQPSVPAAPPAVETQPQTPTVLAPNPAVVSLAKLARSQYQAADYQAAIATAERGLRIDRRAADMYLLLAQSYIQLDQPQKAKMFAQQGLRYALKGSDVEAGLMRVQDLVSKQGL